jgi:hypothetical protein
MAPPPGRRSLSTSCRRLCSRWRRSPTRRRPPLSPTSALPCCSSPSWRFSGHPACNGSACAWSPGPRLTAASFARWGSRRPLPCPARAVAVALWLSVLSDGAAYLGLITLLVWLAISLTLAIKESFACRTGEAIRTLVGTLDLAIAIPIFLSLIIPYYFLRYLYRQYKRPGGPAPKEMAPSRLISKRLATRRQRYRAGIRRRGWA